MSKLRLGIFGGTFDPIHCAHLEVARAALEQGRLDEVLFVVAARPPHKDSDVFASPEDRYAMVEAAVAGSGRMRASRVEIDREGPSYTVDTLRQLAAEHAGAELFLVIGYDSLLDFPGWREPEGILELAQLLVVPRPGLKAPVPREMEGRCRMLCFEETDLSSTEVRERVMAGLPYEDLVPAEVARLIGEKGIYDRS